MRVAICLCALMAATAALAAPVIWQVQDPVKPGETVMLFGDGFGEKPAVAFRRESDGPAATPGTRAADDATYGPGAAVLQASDQCLKVLIAPDRAPGLYRLSVNGNAVTLNRPTLWWAQVEPDIPGATARNLRLFGKNLAGPQAQVYLKGPKTVALPLGKQADTWAATATLPANLPAGSYQVFCHTGYGGHLGWSAGLPVTVATGKPWPAKVYNVKDFGADGSGSRDDTGALQAALDQAGAAGGGVVFLPRGRYQVTAGLSLPRRTILRGEATPLTALFWPDMATPPEALLQGTNSFAVESLTLYASNARHVIVGDLGHVPAAGNVRLWRVRTRVNAYRGHISPEDTDKRHRDLARIFGGDTVRLGGDNVVISECDLYGNGRALYLSRTRNGVVRNNAFYNGRHGWYCLSGSDGLIFEDNRITGADLMATGGGLNCLDGSSYSQNVYYARNTLRTMHGWDREAMTSDAGGGLYYGPLARAEGATLTLPEAPPTGGRNWAGAAVFVFSGRGWTQVRRVVKVEGDRVTVDRPWDVPPDSTSLVGITMMQRHYILERNDFSDAGIAIQFYGTSLEHIVSGNTCARAGGYQGIGKPYGGYNFPPDKNPCHQPSWFCQYVGNAITEGNIYRSGANNAILAGDSVIGVYGWPLTKDWPWPYNVGSVVRGNTLANNARLHVGGNGNDLPAVAEALVENNTLADANEGLRLDRAVRGVVVRGNRFEGVRNPFTGDGVERGWYSAPQLVAAERSRLRAAAADCGVTVDVTQWPTVKQALQALEQTPANTPASRQTSVACAAALLTELSQRQKTLPYATAVSFLGLDVQVSKAGTLAALLQKGGGGSGTLALDLTLARSLPGWRVAAELKLPSGWQADAVGPVALTEGRATLTLPVTAPNTAWGRQELPLQLTLLLPGGQLSLTRPVAVGTGLLREWMVVGPFPNKTGQPLDLSLHPPEDTLDLQAQYEAPAGKLQWQPVVLGGDWLDLAERLQTKEPGVAYAVAGLNSGVAQRALLRLGSSGGVAVILNGEYVWSNNVTRNAGPDQDRVPLSLRPGDNVLLVKLCTVSNQWRFTAELTPPAEGWTGPLSIIPARQFTGRPAFAPPPPRPATTRGEIRFPAGVNWQLVHAEDFTGATLGSRWRAAVGKWSPGPGFVQSRGDKAFLAYAEQLPAPVRLEYDTKTVGQTAGDLSAFWLSDAANYAAGYLFGFGSNGNTLNKILIEGSEVITGPRPLVVPGKWHHVITQVLADGRVQFIVDDQLALDFKGPAPGVPKFPGLWTWGPEGLFAKVRIYRGAAQ